MPNLKFGDRVTFSQLAINRGIPSKKQFSFGLVGVCTFDAKGGFVSVLWKGNKSSSVYAESFIVPDERIDHA